MKKSSLLVVLLAQVLFLAPPSAGATRYQPLLATSAGRDSLMRLALWEDGRVTGDGKLFAYLKSNNPLIRLRAVEVIGRIQDPQDVDYLIPMLKDPDPLVRDEAVFALGQMGSADAVPGLVKLANESAPAAQPIIADALGKIGGEEAITALTEMLHAFQGRVRAGAAIALASVEDPAATNALLVSIHDGDPSVSWRAIYALQDSQVQRARDSVVPFLQSEDPDVRAYAARTLGKQKSDTAVEPLTTTVIDSDSRVTINSINALAAILEGEKDKNVTEFLGKVAEKTNSPQVRMAAVIAIGDIGHKAGENYLAQTMLDPNPGIRAQSYLAMAKILHKKSLVFISGGLKDGDPIVQVAAVEALGISGDDKVINDLIDIAQHNPDPRMRCAAIRGLANFDDDEVVAALVEKLNDGDWVVVTETVTALGKIGKKESVPPMIDRFSMRNDRVDRDVRLEVMRVMTEMRAEEAQQIALDALEDSDPRLRSAAVEYLQAMEMNVPELKGDRYYYERDFDPSRRAELSLPLGTKRAIIRTEHGDIEIELFGDEATQTVASFVRLTESGFYNGLTFHRTVPNFVVQGGCPRADGWGDAGYNIRSEFNAYQYERGMVGIAHAGKDTGGSQFFITLSPQPHLDGRYTIFGKVTKGMEVVDQIAQGDAFTVTVIE